MQRANGGEIRMLIDLVVDHTSDRREWFQEPRKDRESKHRDWYIWSNKRPKHGVK